MDHFVLLISNCKGLRNTSSNPLVNAPVRVAITSPLSTGCVDQVTKPIKSVKPEFNSCHQLAFPRHAKQVAKLSVISGDNTDIGTVSLSCAEVVELDGDYGKWVSQELVLGGDNAKGTITVLIKRLLKNPTIYIDSASRLANMDGLFGKSDPYAKVTNLVGAGKVWGTSKTIRDNLNPDFGGEKFTIPLLTANPAGGKLTHLRIELWDEDRGKTDDKLGYADIPFISLFHDSGEVVYEAMKLTGAGSKRDKGNTVSVRVGREGEEDVTSLVNKLTIEPEFPAVPPPPGTQDSDAPVPPPPAQEGDTPIPVSDDSTTSGGAEETGQSSASNKFQKVTRTAMNAMKMGKVGCKVTQGHGFHLANCTDNIADNFTLGLGWDVSPDKKVDLDISCVMLDEKLQDLDRVWWKKLHSEDGSMKHLGDNRSGAGEGDDEKIEFDLEKVDPKVTYLCFSVNNYTKGPLNDVLGAQCHLFNSNTKAEVGSFDITSNDQMSGTALLVCILYREGGAGSPDWCFYALGQPADGATIKENIGHFRQFLERHPLAFEQHNEFAACKSKKVLVQVPDNAPPSSSSDGVVVVRTVDYRLDSGKVQHIELPPNAVPGEFVEVNITEVFEESEREDVAEEDAEEGGN